MGDWVRQTFMNWRGMSYKGCLLSWKIKMGCVLTEIRSFNLWLIEYEMLQIDVCLGFAVTKCYHLVYSVLLRVQSGTYCYLTFSLPIVV